MAVEHRRRLAGELDGHHHLPAGIAGSRRIRRWQGVRIASWLGRTLERQVAGVGGVVTLGILLGMSPVVGQFWACPRKFRHVTPSTGSLTLSAATDHGGGARLLLSRDYLYAASGILLILAANFGVSFMLALWVALRARGVRSRELFGWSARCSDDCGARHWSSSSRSAGGRRTAPALVKTPAQTGDGSEAVARLIL